MEAQKGQQSPVLQRSESETDRLLSMLLSRIQVLLHDICIFSLQTVSTASLSVNSQQVELLNNVSTYPP